MHKLQLTHSPSFTSTLSLQTRQHFVKREHEQENEKEPQ